MTAHPFAIAATEKLSAARSLMVKRAIHHLPVIGENGDVIGILTERELFPIHPLHDITVGETMTDDVPFVPASTPMDEVLEIMQENGCGSVVIKGPNGVEGIFTVTDALRALADLFRRTVENVP